MKAAPMAGVAGAGEPNCPSCGHRPRAHRAAARRRELRRSKRRGEQQWRSDWRNALL